MGRRKIRCTLMAPSTARSTASEAKRESRSRGKSEVGNQYGGRLRISICIEHLRAPLMPVDRRDAASNYDAQRERAAAGLPMVGSLGERAEIEIRLPRDPVLTPALRRLMASDAVTVYRRLLQCLATGSMSSACKGDVSVSIDHAIVSLVTIDAHLNGAAYS
jgi:hypothetical protein